MNTHVHADHVTGSGLLKKRIPGLRSVLGAPSRGRADVYLKHGDVLRCGGIAIEARNTPGHTNGCMYSTAFFPLTLHFHSLLQLNESFLIVNRCVGRSSITNTASCSPATRCSFAAADAPTFRAATRANCTTACTRTFSRCPTISGCYPLTTTTVRYRQPTSQQSTHEESSAYVSTLYCIVWPLRRVCTVVVHCSIVPYTCKVQCMFTSSSYTEYWCVTEYLSVQCSRLVSVLVQVTERCRVTLLRTLSVRECASRNCSDSWSRPTGVCTARCRPHGEHCGRGEASQPAPHEEPRRVHRHHEEPEPPTAQTDRCESKSVLYSVLYSSSSFHPSISPCVLASREYTL